MPSVLSQTTARLRNAWSLGIWTIIDSQRARTTAVQNYLLIERNDQNRLVVARPCWAREGHILDARLLAHEADKRVKFFLMAVQRIEAHALRFMNFAGGGTG